MVKLFLVFLFLSSYPTQSELVGQGKNSKKKKKKLRDDSSAISRSFVTLARPRSELFQ